jgi:hypothetical protein
LWKGIDPNAGVVSITAAVDKHEVIIMPIGILRIENAYFDGSVASFQ